MTACPVYKVIQDIYNGGYTDDAARTITVTGSDDPFVCDDTTYHTNIQRISLARLKLDPQRVALVALKMYGDLPALTVGDLYVRMINRLGARTLLEIQLAHTIDSIRQRPSLGHACIPYISRSRLVAYNCEALAANIGKLISYVERYGVRITSLDAPPTPDIDMDAELPLDTSAPTIPALEATLEIEQTVATYVTVVERFYCSAIQKLHEIRNSITDWDH